MDENDQSNVKSGKHEQSWQIVRKQGAVFIKGMIIIMNYIIKSTWDCIYGKIR